MYFYNAYKLGIHSDLPLPELVAVSKPAADVIIRLGKLNRPLEIIGKDNYLHLTAKEAYLSWNKIGAFLVRDGQEIIIEPVPGVEANLLRLPLLGVVMATLLHQRGLLVLHASAVALNGGAIAFLGGKRWGKSTIAAALHARGHSFLADDIVALDIGATKSPMVLPAFPQFKLWPDTIASLGADVNTSTQLASSLEKRSYQVTRRFLQQTIPLISVYILDLGLLPAIESFQPQEAIIQLIRNLYPARFGKQLLRAGEATNFLQCAELVKNVPIYCLKRPASLPMLPKVVQLVENNIAGIEDLA